MNNKEIGNRIAELHYPNTPNVVHDKLYRKIRMKTLAQQVEDELNLLNIDSVVLPTDKEGTLVCENRTSMGSEDRCCYCGAKRGKPCNFTN